ncbi:hypothetical protein BGX38DRAFT_1193924, partial [Terfezia claveryi]
KAISGIGSLLFVQNSMWKLASCQFLSRNCLLVNLMVLRNILQRERRCFHVSISSTSILKPKY